MRTRQQARVRGTVVLGVVSVLSVGLVTGMPASAAGGNKVSYYSATEDTGQVRYATDSTKATTVTFTITNCGSASSPPSDCSRAKGGSAIASIAITLPAQWTAVNAASLTATGLKLAPGASIAMPVQVLTAPVSSVGAAQAVTMCVSDATQCSFQPTGANLTLEVPLAFSFTQPPSTGTPGSSLCNTAVQLTDGFTPADNVPLGGVAVTLAAATNSLDPTFSFDSTNTPSTVAGPSDVAGSATFGCDPKPSVGGPYSVVAVGQYAGSSIPSASSRSFVVFTNLNTQCNGNCSDSLTGGGGTRIDDTVSNGQGDLGTSAFDALTDGHFPTFTCSGVKKVEGRPDVVQASADGNKTVVITWSKAVTLKFTDNGTPHWQVCMEAPVTFITDAGLPATPNGDFFVGSIPICGAPGIPAANPCMQVSRNAAQEIATITLPSSWAGDPYFH